MTLRVEGVWGHDVKVATATATGCEGEKGSYNYEEIIMNIMVRAIVRNTVNVCGQRL